MPKGNQNKEPATGTPEAPLYVKGAPAMAEMPAPADAPAVVIKPVPIQMDVPPEPSAEDATAAVPSIREALEKLDKESPAEPGEISTEKAIPSPVDKGGKPTPKGEAVPAAKPEPAKPDDVMARLRADLAAKTRNEQAWLSEKAVLMAEVVAAQQEADEVARVADEGGDVVAIRQKWAAQHATRRSTNAVAVIGNDIDQFLSEAGYKRDESNPNAFAAHPVIDRIAQVFGKDPQHAWSLAYEEWRRVAPAPGNGATAQPASPSAPSGGPPGAGEKTYTEAEVKQRVAEAEQRAHNAVREEALSAASTAQFPDGVTSKNLDAEFRAIEDPSEKIRWALRHAK